MQQKVYYHVLSPCKESCSKRCITIVSSDDRALLNSRFWKLSFNERRQLLAAYINQVDVKNKTSQQKDDSRLSSTLSLKSDRMITEMEHVRRQSYDGAIAPIEDRGGSHPPSNKCDVEAICQHINL